MSIEHPHYRRLTRVHAPDWTTMQRIKEAGPFSPGYVSVLLEIARRGELDLVLDRMKQPARILRPGEFRYPS